MIKSKNIRREAPLVTVLERTARNGHSGAVVWLTGLSGAGKSTLARLAERNLFDEGWQVVVLDGDNLRLGLNSDLGFSPENRVENIRRVGEVAALFASAGVVVIAAFISPYERDRRMARAAAVATSFYEVYISAPVSECERRDVKGLYGRARRGEISDFTGISAPYEVPASPDLVLDTVNRSIEDCLHELIAHIVSACAPNPAS